MKTNKLSYTASKNYVENGTTCRIDVKIQFADECKNGVCSWSITADIYGKRQNGRFVWCSGGCCHDEISKHFPEFSKFVALHLSDCYGAPLYAVENGYYHMKNSSKEKAAQKAYEKKRAEIIAECERKVSKLEEEKTVKLYILDSGLPVDNVIYYEHKKEVVFNWLEYKDKISQDVFIDFLNNVDYSKLPKGITFKIK